MGRNRDRLSIVAAILETANSGATKSHFKITANLSFRLLEKYLNIAVGAGLVRVDGCTYKSTERGRGFLKQYKHFRERYVEARKLLEALKCDWDKLSLMCEDSGLPVSHGRSVVNAE